jgi:GntR family transcriptional regulator
LAERSAVLRSLTAERDSPPPSQNQVGLPELAVLRRSLLGWLSTADAAGLDEDGIVALFTTALQDFRLRRGPSNRRGAADAEREDIA